MISNLLVESELPAYVELFELDCTNIGGQSYRFTNSSQNGLSFGGLDYVYMPIEFDGIDIKGSGAQSRPTMTISNITKVLLSATITLGDLVGAKVSRIRTFETYLDTGSSPNQNQKLPVDSYYISAKKVHTRDVMQFELCTALDKAQIKLPRRQVTKQGDSRYGGFPNIGVGRV